MRGRRHEYSQRDLVKLGQAYFSEHGVTTTTTYKKMKSKEMPSVSTIYNYFGNWNEFLKECGYEVNYLRYSKEEVSAFIKEFYSKHNRPPMLKEINYTSSLMTHYGNFKNCLEAVLGIDIRRYENDYLKLKCAAMKAIDAFYKKQNRFPTVTEWRQNNLSPATSHLHRSGLYIPDLVDEFKKKCF